VGVEVSEFISDNGEGEILPRRAKRRKANFCEIIIFGPAFKSKNDKIEKIAEYSFKIKISRKMSHIKS